MISSFWARTGAVLAVAGGLFVALATLTPVSDPGGLALLTPIWCLVCGGEGGADVLANLLLFLPFAIGLRLTGVSWRRTVLLSAAMSLTVELLQLTVVRGRDASLSDLLTNTGSAAIGAAIAPHIPGAFHPSPARARRLLAGGLAVWLTTMTLATWLLMPSMPDGRLMSRWAHEAPGRDVFGGRVSAVHLDGQPMPKDGPPPDSAELRRRLDAGRFTLDAEITSGAPVADRSWIYMFRVPSGGGLSLYQLGRDAGIAVPVRGLDYLTRHATVTLPDGLPSVAGLPVQLHATERDGKVSLTSTYAGVTRTVELGISPAYGWRLISPFELGAGTGVRRFTALCIALSVLPLACWAAHARGMAPALLASGIVFGLAGLPWLAGFPPVDLSEWLAACLGVLAGWAVWRGAAYLERRCALPSASEFSSS